MGAIQSTIYSVRSRNDDGHVIRDRWGRFKGYITGLAPIGETNNDPNTIKKVTIIGYGTTGKTTLCKFLKGVDHHGDYNPTKIAEAFFLNDKKICLWDTSGDEQYSALIPIYTLGSDKLIMVFSPDQPNSLKTIDPERDYRIYSWQCEIIIVYNEKRDKSYEKYFTLDDLKAKCETYMGGKYHYKIFEVSLLENINTESLIEEILYLEF
ncbi:Ras family protein [Histomonas meleagridis]|uniref:Ras family protein n=1 Tax=Histomonas meleagridis TaxID=135588 RepID=UPI00355992F5|nr:Ras family protein [Histomonas meleagridis]